MKLIDADMLKAIPITKGLAGKKHINDSYMRGVKIVMDCIDALPDLQKKIQVLDILRLCAFCECKVVDAFGQELDEEDWKAEEIYYLTVSSISTNQGIVLIWTHVHEGCAV